MFGLEFLFSAALWALPLAGLPILLHLLMRRKSPIVPFSTLRFIRASVQRTAARKRIQRWLLLACRALLLALLIWAVAQPARKLATTWAGSKSLAAAIVVDTSYSMQLQSQQVTLLSRADSIVQDLLREPLKDARVAVFKSAVVANTPEQLQNASQILSQWTPLAPQPARVPFADRIASAMDLLRRQQADERWLIIISDFQANQFPHAPPEFKDGKVILMDLRPREPRSNGITRVAVSPRLPIPGLPRDAVVDVTGHVGEPRVEVSLTAPDGHALNAPSMKIASFDTSGRAQARVPIVFPAQRWLQIRARLLEGDDLTWDNERSELVEVPPRQTVALLEAPSAPAVRRIIGLALDPSEGQLGAWPLLVKSAPDLLPEATVVALASSEWPDEARTARLLSFVRGGGTLIWFLRPGLEATWAPLTPPHKNALLALLPSEPLQQDVAESSIVSPASLDDPVLEGLTDPAYELDKMAVLRFVPFSVVEPPTAVILNASPRKPTSHGRLRGLVFRRGIGTGTVFTFAILPESQYGNLATHQLLLPMLVNMALRPATRGDVQNVELGESLSVAGNKYDGTPQLQISGPGGEVNVVTPADSKNGRRFEFMQADAPGLYAWRRPGTDEIVAMANVQLPAAEADLTYRAPDSLFEPGPGVLIATSVAELQNRFTSLSEPQPRWTLPIAIVLFLLCIEALLGSIPKLRKPPSLRALFAPRIAADSP